MFCSLSAEMWDII